MGKITHKFYKMSDTNIRRIADKIPTVKGVYFHESNRNRAKNR